jgi:glycolate oxidase FAD binding subunit
MIGDVLDTRPYRGIVDYDATELVMTARPAPLSEIEETMRQSGQMLAFEPPHFGGASATTLGMHRGRTVRSAAAVRRVRA